MENFEAMTDTEARQWLIESLAKREEDFAQSIAPSFDAALIGASNAPSDPTMYSGDYRERLHPQDPVRLEAEQDGSLRASGSAEAAAALQAAHIAGLAIARSAYRNR